jgi:Tfp pilus assembly protein PilF
MDCRRPLALGLALLGGVAGCQHPGAPAPQAPPKAPVKVTALKSAEEAVARKASTFVAFGDFRARAAVAPEFTPEAQRQYREEARRAYRQALEIDPSCVSAYLGLAHLWEGANDQARAADSYRKALEINDKDALVWFELGMCQCRQRHWAQGVDSVRRALERDPENQRYLSTLGFILARTGRYEESLACLAQVVGPARAHYDLARMLRHLQQPDLARQHLQAALALDPRLADARALLNELEGRPTAALQPVSYTEPAAQQQPEAQPGPSKHVVASTTTCPVRIPPLPVISIQARKQPVAEAGPTKEPGARE